jgi:hypothetical protein
MICRIDESTTNMKSMWAVVIEVMIKRMRQVITNKDFNDNNPHHDPHNALNHPHPHKKMEGETLQQF